MLYVFKQDIIDELIKIMDLMSDSMRRIIEFENDCDYESYQKEMETFIMYINKENFLLSKIPRDMSVINYIYDYIIDRNNYSLINESNVKYVVARFLSCLNDIVRTLPIGEVYEDLDEEYYEDEKNYQNVCNLIRNNLLIDYIKSFRNSYMVSYDIGTNYTFRNIQYYNVFLSKPIFDNFVKCNFNFDDMKSYSDEEICDRFNLDRKDYLSLKNEIIYSSISDFIDILFEYNSDKSDITMLDYLLNLKFCLKKISTEDVRAVLDTIMDYFKNKDINDTEFGRDVFDAVSYELSLRDDITEKEDNDEEAFNLSVDSFNKLGDLFRLENDLYDKFYSLNFDKKDNSTDISHLLIREKEMISKIDFSTIPINVLDEMISNELWIYVDENSNNKISLIKQRLYTVIPLLKDLFIPSSQSNKSYGSIYRNYLVKNLTDFYKLTIDLKNRELKEVFKKIYKDNFFVNSELTDELVALNGNVSIITPLSDDTVMLESNVSEVEYRFDKNNQIYKFAVGSFDYLLENEKCIETISDYANYQFQSISFVNAVNELDMSYLYELKQYVRSKSSFFSPLRRDITKIINNGISHIS